MSFSTQANCSFPVLTNDLFVKLYQSIMIKADFATLIAGIRGEVTGREEIIKVEADFFRRSVMFQCLTVDVKRPDTICHEF